MKKLRVWRLCVLAALTSIVLCVGAGPAQGAASDPLFVFAPVRPNSPYVPFLPPPQGNFNALCGAGVDSAGDFYVSDYYRHAVDVYDGNTSYGFPPQFGLTGYITQLAGVDPLDGPCALSFDASDSLYVNDYHRAVIKYGPKFGFGSGTAIAGAGVDSTHPTGVSVDKSSGDVYVDARTYVAVYDSSGSPVMDNGEPLRIGKGDPEDSFHGDLEDGYGVAVSEFPATAGFVYVPDAATGTVKVYDPSVDKVVPVAEIDGTATPEGKFVSLRDSAVAVDRVTGEVYVVDDLQPLYTERPHGVVYVFSAGGIYEGHLKYMIRDALPPGLAVDNSPSATYPAGTQGRVYVTSGNTEGAAVYGYPSGAATTAAPKPSSYSLTVTSSGAGSGFVSTDLGEVECTSTCEAEIHAGATVSMTATPDSGSSFSGWSGACAGSGASCAVQMEESTQVQAQFSPIAAPEGGGSISAPAASPSAAAGPAAVTRHRARRHHRHRRRHHRRVHRIGKAGWGRIR